jgi:glycosyltransferase involved in cell wall biosynthesis
MKPLVSVVIPNYNYARYVGAAIESVLAQTYQPIEIIVVDNGSTDNSLEVLRAFGKKIQLISQENRGQAGARNRGIEASGGEWIAFCDADDIWLPEKISAQMAIVDRKTIGLVYAGHTVVDAELRPLREVTPQNRGWVLPFFARDMKAVIPGGESCALIRKECFAKTGVFDLRLSTSSGYDLYRRIAQHYEVEFVPQSLMLYRQHQSNASKHIEAFEHDVFIALEKMFSDPFSSAIFSMRRTCYGRTHLSISGSYLRAGYYGKAVSHLFRGLFYAPQEIIYVLFFPLRQFQRARVS